MKVYKSILINELIIEVEARSLIEATINGRHKTEYIIYTRIVSETNRINNYLNSSDKEDENYPLIKKKFAKQLDDYRKENLNYLMGLRACRRTGQCYSLQPNSFIKVIPPLFENLYLI